MEDSSEVDTEEVCDPSLEEEEKLATMLLSGNDDNDDDDDDKDSLQEVK